MAAFTTSLPCRPEVWTSQDRRTQQTAAHLTGPKVVVPELGEILAGEHDGMTYEEIAAQFPEEFAQRDADKLRYRYPGGESYVDVVRRVEPVVKALRTSPGVMVISHQATLRYMEHISG